MLLRPSLNVPQSCRAEISGHGIVKRFKASRQCTIGLYAGHSFPGLDLPLRPTKPQNARTHEHILAIAPTRFREAGLAGFGIAELMKEAGLTVGGFYEHFDSSEDLVAEAVSSAFGGWRRRFLSGSRIGYAALYGT